MRLWRSVSQSSSALPTSSTPLIPALRLNGARLYLRPPRVEDWPSWSALRADSQQFLQPWEPSWPTDALSKEAFIRRLRRQSQEWRYDQAYAFLLYRQENDALLGGLNLSQLRRGVSQAVTLGYWMGANYAGQGLMSEAVGVVLEFCFRQLGLHRVEAASMPHNPASRRVLEKCGFQEEGYAKGYLRIAGHWQDHVLYAITQEMWLSK
jgi:[ribosomal protein S5]-alanine N-acetyltransferase